MFDARRPLGRLFCLLLLALAAPQVSRAQTRRPRRSTKRTIAQQQGIDNSLGGAVRHVKEPPPRTPANCENVALVLLDDATGAALSGRI
jgi:hypothetical protein